MKRADITLGEQYALRASKYDTPKPVTVLSLTARRRISHFGATFGDVEITVAGKTWAVPGLFDPRTGKQALVVSEAGTYAAVALKSLFPLSAIADYQAERQAEAERRIREQAAEAERRRESEAIVQAFGALGLEARSVSPFRTVVLPLESAREVADRLALLK